MTDPKFGDLVKITKDGWDGIPDSASPFYVGAKDGLFVHRRLMFGRGLVRIHNWPDNFAEVGSSVGRFIFEADPIPAKMMAQIVDFFSRIYAKQQTEAAVLLTMDNETHEWSVFVPTQLVSHGGVNYVYDPAHISPNRTVVGSIHSHANFSPFHSGTDTGDAADFDGLHCTIGFVDKDPKIVAMISMNKSNLHYQEKDFEIVFDWSEIGQHTAPEWWDQYVGTNAKDSKPVGHELYAKFAKPVTIKEHVKTAVPVGQPYTKTPHQWVPRPYDREIYTQRQMASDWGIPDYGYRGGYQTLRESQEFNARKTAERGLEWKNGALVVRSVSPEELKALGTDDDFWEDHLPRKFVEALLDSNLVTDDDIDLATADAAVGGDVKFWIEKLLTKTVDAADLLRMVGVRINITLQTDDREFPLNPVARKSKKGRLHAVR